MSDRDHDDQHAERDYDGFHDWDGNAVVSDVDPWYALGEYDGAAGLPDRADHLYGASASDRAAYRRGHDIGTYAADRYREVCDAAAGRPDDDVSGLRGDFV